MIRLFFIISTLFYSILFGNVEISLTNYSVEHGTAEVTYNSDVAIGGFQFDIEGAILSTAEGGDAADVGFSQSCSESTFLGFSMLGSSIPAGNGILTMITIADIYDMACITNPVVSDGEGNSLDVILVNNCIGENEIEGCLDPEACNYHSDTTIEIECLYPEVNFDCYGNCIAELDCNGDCGGFALEDNCGVCDSDSTNDCVQDCAGVWGGNAVTDECGVCNGNGPSFLCENGEVVCNYSQCVVDLECESGAGYKPNYGPGCQWNTFGSTLQSFILIGEITLNGEPVSHGIEGSPTGDCPTNDCDILAAIYNGQTVGWSYLPILNNAITLVVELKDANTEAVSGYPQVIPGIFQPTITFNFYDASEGTVFYNVGTTQPVVQGLVNFGDLNIDGNGDYCSSDGFEFGATEFCLEGIGCELTQYCNGEPTTNFDAIGNNAESCASNLVCGHSEAVNYDLFSECDYFDNDLSICTFNGCEDYSALNYNIDELVSYEEFEVGCLYDPFEWLPSTMQSFYVVNELIIDGEYITEENTNLVIGAFCNDVAVGSAEWDGSTTTIAVYGADGLTYGTEDYCMAGFNSPIDIPGDIPTFKVYDPYNDIYYHTHFDNCLDIEGNASNCEWFNFGYTNITELTTTIPGCTDENACNFNEFATIDDGSCWSPNEGCTCDFPQGSVVDCFGICAGDALEDDCGICNGFNADMDCYGECFGTAIVDDCEVCSGGNTGLDYNADMDCSGLCFGNWVFDECGECGGNGYDQCDYDENGVSNFEQYGYGVYNIEVTDIPDDQGYQVYVSFTGSFLDDYQNSLSQNVENTREVEIYQVERLDEIGWVSVGQSVMHGQDNYIVQVPTIINQTNESEGLSTFRVLSAFEDEVIVSFENGVGASIDNISPQIPNNLAGSYQNNMVQLNWGNSVDADFQYFKIYGNGELINYSIHSEFLNETPNVGINSYYQISAVDINGNESDLSVQILTLEICNNEISNCYGCTDEDAGNYSMYAIMDDGNCEFSPVEIVDENLENYDENAEITISGIELNEVELDIEIPAGAFDFPEGSTINMVVSEASENEIENILYYSSSAASGIEIMQGISVMATNENGIAIELTDGSTIDIAITFDLIRGDYDLGFIQENGEIIGLNSTCINNEDETMTCIGEGDSMGSYIVFSYNPDFMEMGCTMVEACNYNDFANMNDGSCFFYGIYDCAGNCVNDADSDLVCDELEIPGCMDMEANNYDEDATDDDGTCIFGYNFTHNLSLGNNLLSLPGDLENNSSIHQMDLIQSTGESIAFIIGQGVGLFNTNEGWTGNLMNLSPYSGYWLNISSSNNYQWDLEFSNSVENCEIYPNISVGNNLISFKWGNGSAPTLESLGGEEFASENFNFIIGQGVGLFNTNDGWSGNLNSLEEGKGYWVNVQENLNEFKWGFDNCIENPSNLGMTNTEISNNLLSEFTVQQSTNQAFYLIEEILIDGENPKDGDLLVAYNNEVVVGVTKYSQDLSILPVMGEDLSIQTEGYLEIGVSPQLKLHSHQTGEVTDLQFKLAGFDNLLVSQVDKIEVNTQEIPMELVLNPAYPNPFNPTTTINFGIPEMVETRRVTTLQVFDINGHLIETLVNSELSPGNHSIEWDASQHPSGVYFAKLVSGDPSINSGQGFTQSQKLVLIK